MAEQQTKCRSNFSVAGIEYCDKINIREEGRNLARSSRVQSIMAKKSRQRGLEAGGHLAATARKQENIECRLVSAHLFT